MTLSNSSLSHGNTCELTISDTAVPFRVSSGGYRKLKQATDFCTGVLMSGGRISKSDKAKIVSYIDKEHSLLRIPPSSYGRTHTLANYYVSHIIAPKALIRMEIARSLKERAGVNISKSLMPVVSSVSFEKVKVSAENAENVDTLYSSISKSMRHLDDDICHLQKIHKGKPNKHEYLVCYKGLQASTENFDKVLRSLTTDEKKSLREILSELSRFGQPDSTRLVGGLSASSLDEFFASQIREEANYIISRLNKEEK